MIDKTKFAQLLKDKYVFENETFKREVKQNPKDRIEVEIGDSKQPDFKPQFKFMRWDNEVNFSLRAEEDPTAKVETDGEKIVYKHKDYDVVMYDRPEVAEDGGFEFEWILPKKPTSNVLKTTIQTKELDFFYQPPLTPEEMAEGSTDRPENVIGSYAVYHKTKGGMNRSDGMEYKVGKAFHIYRPKVIDASGSETWGELNINEASEELTVTINQTYLNNAVYPVVVDPTFGYTSVGATQTSVTSQASNVQSSRLGRGFNLAVDGTLDSLHAALVSPDGADTVDHMMFLNRENTATDSHDEVASSETLELSISNSATFYTFTCSSEVIVADDYVISVVGNGADPVVNTILAHDTGASGTVYFEAKTGVGSYANAKESPWTETDASQTTLRSIYATYTASGGGTAVEPTGRMTTNTLFWGP